MTAHKSKSAAGRKPAPRKGPRIMVTDDNLSTDNEVRWAGGDAVRATNGWGGLHSIDDDVRALALCDGLVITGGGDVNPDLYAAERHREVYGVSARRDLRELALIGAARDLGIPVLGICRGAQLLAVEAGGALVQHLHDVTGTHAHDYGVETVHTVKGSVLARTMGEHPRTVHLHHQAIRQVPKGLSVTARHADGTVEAIESVDGRVVGVQFHPELEIGKTCTDSRPLLRAFVGACERYRRRHRGARVALREVKAYREAWPVAVSAFDRMMSAAHRPAVVVKPAQASAVVFGRFPWDREVARPIAYCGDCGLAFDRDREWQDHNEHFHGLPSPIGQSVYTLPDGSHVH